MWRAYACFLFFSVGVSFATADCPERVSLPLVVAPGMGEPIGDVVSLLLLPMLERPRHAIGREIGSVEEGHRLLQGLAAGDRSALMPLGLGPLPEWFPPELVEWGLAQHRETGRYALFLLAVDGANGAQVQPEYRVVAHTHPFENWLDRMARSRSHNWDHVSTPFLRGAPETLAGILADRTNRNLTGLFPSAGDAAYWNENGRGEVHHIFTAFRDLGDGRIARAISSEPGPRVVIELSAVREILPLHFSRTGERFPSFRLWLRLRNTDGLQLWSGRMDYRFEPVNATQGRWFYQLSVVRPW